MNWKHILIVCTSLSCTAMMCEKNPVIMGQNVLRCTIDGEKAVTALEIFTPSSLVDNSVSVRLNDAGDSVWLHTYLRSQDNNGWYRDFHIEKKLKSLIQKQWPPVDDYEVFNEVYEREFGALQPESCYVFMFKMVFPVAKMTVGNVLSEQECKVDLYWYAFLPYDPRKQFYIKYQTETAEVIIDAFENKQIRCRFNSSGHIKDDSGLGYDGDSYIFKEGFLDLEFPHISYSISVERGVKERRDFILKYKQEHEGY